jgi:CBS domain-containing protein
MVGPVVAIRAVAFGRVGHFLVAVLVFHFVVAAATRILVFEAGAAFAQHAEVMIGEKRIGALPVLVDGRIVGIISERDVIYCLREHGSGALDLPVERAMSSPAITADLATDVLDALGMMTQRRIRHLPVVEAGQIRGIVSIGDLVKYRMERIEAEAEAMRAYIQSA